MIVFYTFVCLILLLKIMGFLKKTSGKKNKRSKSKRNHDFRALADKILKKSNLNKEDHLNDEKYKKIHKDEHCFEKKNGVVISNLPGYFLIACLIISGLFLIKIMSPFIIVLVVSAILVTVFYGAYKRILSLVNNNEIIASFISTFLIIVLIIVPLFVFVILLGGQARDVYVYIVEQVRAGALDWLIKWSPGGFLYDSLIFFREHLSGLIDFDSIDIKGSIMDLAKTVTSWLVEQSTSLLKGFFWLLVNFVVLGFSMFFMFKDGDIIIERIKVLSPLPDKHEERLFKKFYEISNATLYGIFLTAIVQGTLGGIGFAIVGIPNALFWGTAIAIFSLVPVVGTGIVWLPASLLLLADQNWFGGIFLLFWGAGIVSTVDNFIRPYLISGKTKMNQLLMFLSVFGGIFAFNLIGVLLGPLILTLFFAFLHIYEKEYDILLNRN